MSKQTLLFSFLDKFKCVSIESEIKGAEQEVNEPVGKERAVCTKKYDDSYIAFGFVETCDSETSKLQCVVCGDVLSSDAMKPLKLKRYLSTRHSELGKKPKNISRGNEMN
jgi:hypothetical protein